MCGIAGIHRRNDADVVNVDAACKAMLSEIQHRGRDATGALALHDDGVVGLSRGCVPASRFIAKGMMPQTIGARTILLHTRFATVGRRDDVRNAHPQVNSGHAAIHNGTIYNADKIFKAFELPRLAEVDSEIIPAIVAAFGWENAGSGLELLDGGAATAIVDESHPRNLILARTQDYPMCYVVTDEVVLWGSTADTVQAAHMVIYGTKAARVERLAEFHMLRCTDGVVSIERFSDREPDVYRGWMSSASTPKGTGRKARRARRGRRGKHGGGATKRSAREAAVAMDVWTASEDAELDYLISEGFTLEDALTTVLEGQDVDWMWEDDTPTPVSGSRRNGWPWEATSTVEHFDD